jgi:hypothetical protein
LTQPWQEKRRGKADMDMDANNEKRIEDPAGQTVTQPVAVEKTKI